MYHLAGARSVPTSPCSTMAATNRPETLDPALLRAGRFDRQVLVDKPDVTGREQILLVHAKKIVLAPDVELAVIARKTPGFSGADLANAINEAALLAARKDKDAVGMAYRAPRLGLGLGRTGPGRGVRRRAVAPPRREGRPRPPRAGGRPVPWW